MLILAALLVVGAEVLAGVVADPDARPVDRLSAPPEPGGVWLVGNSMMETGVDLAVLAEAVERPVDLEYHGANYTLLWYLIARNALPDLDEKPAVVVWGFRPHTAAVPELRPNDGGSAEDFLVADDPVVDRLVRHEGEPWVGARVSRSAADAVRDSGLWPLRDDADRALDDATLDGAIALLDRLGADGSAALIDERVRNGQSTLGDLTIWLATDGAVEFLDERVDDLAGAFISGEPRPFAETFIPEIARVIAEQGIPQVAVMYAQVAAVRGDRDPAEAEAEDAFAADARAFFAEQGIELVDMYADERLTPEDFGGGDHLALGGRELMTAEVAAAVQRLLDP